MRRSNLFSYACVFQNFDSFFQVYNLNRDVDKPLADTDTVEKLLRSYYFELETTWSTYLSRQPVRIRRCKLNLQDVLQQAFLSNKDIRNYISKPTDPNIDARISFQHLSNLPYV